MDRVITVPEIRNATDAFLWNQRVEFFDVLAKLVPQTLESLRDEVLPIAAAVGGEPENFELYEDQYGSLYREHGFRTETIWLTLPEDVGGGSLSFVSSSTLRGSAHVYKSKLVPIDEALTAWGQRFHLTQKASDGNSPPEVPSWVRDIAWTTVYVWLRRPDLASMLKWYPPDGNRHVGYDYTRKSIFKRWQPQHHKWLVLFQVCGLSPGRIADRLGAVVSDNAILRGIHTAARTIGINARQGKRGRVANQ